MRQLPQRRQPLLQHGAQRGTPLHQPVPLQVADGGEAGGARHRVVRERLRVQEAPGAVGDHVDDPLGRRHSRQRRVPARDPLAERHDVRHRAVRLDRPPCPRPARAAQDLVRDEEHLVAVADLPHPPEVFGARRGSAGRGATHRLGDERRHPARADPRDRLFQHRPAAHWAAGILTPARAPVGIGRRDPMDVDQPVPEHGPVVLARRCGEGQQRVPVIGRGERDDLVLCGLSRIHPVLARQLQRRFHRLGAARQEVQLVEVAGESGGELSGQLLDGAVREGRAREIAELPRLLRHGVGDVGVRVAEVGDVGAADGVEIALAAVVDEPAPLAAHDAGEGTPQLAVENVSIGIPVSRHPSLRSLRLRGKLRRRRPRGEPD